MYNEMNSIGMKDFKEKLYITWCPLDIISGQSSQEPPNEKKFIRF